MADNSSSLQLRAIDDPDVQEFIEDMEDPQMHIVRIGAPNNPDPYTVVAEDFKGLVPAPCPVPAKKRAVLVICNSTGGVAPAVNFCVQLRQGKCKLPVMVKVMQPRKNPDWHVMVVQALLSAGATKVVIGNMMLDSALMPSKKSKTVQTNGITMQGVDAGLFNAHRLEVFGLDPEY